MFPGAYFGARFFAARYFPKVGATVVFHPWWASQANKTIGLTIQPE